jgi:transcriptional regulator with XRE-family HTH domain
MQPKNDRLTKIEQALHESEQFVDDLFPKDECEVADFQAMFGDTPMELPERLREPLEVLGRIEKKDSSTNGPTEFGKVLKFLRTEKGLTIEQLASKTELDVDELKMIESSPSAPSPLMVCLLAQYFRFNQSKLDRLAGLTWQNTDSTLRTELCVAACSKTNFNELTRAEKLAFHQFVKQLRK